MKRVIFGICLCVLILASCSTNMNLNLTFNFINSSTPRLTVSNDTMSDDIIVIKYYTTGYNQEPNWNIVSNSLSSPLTTSQAAQIDMTGTLPGDYVWLWVETRSGLLGKGSYLFQTSSDNWECLVTKG